MTAPESPTPTKPLVQRRALIDEVRAFFRGSGEADPKTNEILVAAMARGAAAADTENPSRELATIVFVADALCGLAIERGLSRSETFELLDRVARVLHLSTDHVESAVFLHAIRDPRFLVLPPRLAVELHMRLLVTLTPVIEASLWKSDRGPLECLIHVGEGAPTRRMRAVARDALAKGEVVSSERALVHAVPVNRWERPAAALVLRLRPGDGPRGITFGEEVAAVIAIVLERVSLLDRSMARERSLVEAGERRLVRLGFDIHDGPIQDVSALAGDLRLFKKQLGAVVPADSREPLLGRVDDIEARLAELDRELRELAQSLEAPTILRKPLEQVLQRELDAFGASNDIAATLELAGSFGTLTPSQRIALVRVVQEALTNVREHSGASEVRVAVTVRRGFVQATITDNGRGFDVEQALVRAAKVGRLGLVGMSERVRLLGGTFDLQSLPGGPTTITLALPEWRPLEAERSDELADPAR